MKLSLGKTGALLSLALAAAACTTGPADDTTSTEDALRELAPEEILGEMKYGDTKDVDLTPSPRFRAFWFMGEKGDQIEMTAQSLDATDPIMIWADDQLNTLAVNNDVRVTDTSSMIANRFLPKSGKYFVVVSEINRAPRAKFAVSLRKTGKLPESCDPDGIGTWDSSCTNPPEYNPFDPASCTGAPLPTAEARQLFSVQGGFKPQLARVYYQTRQCGVTPAGTECSPWQYAFAMDVPLATIAPKENAPGVYTFATATTRKSKIDFEFEAPGPEDDRPEPFLTSACIDGPFAAGPLSQTFGADWAQFPDGTAGVCADTAAVRQRSAGNAIMTRNCARFEMPTIKLGAPEATYYTELNPVLHAKF